MNKSCIIEDIAPIIANIPTITSNITFAVARFGWLDLMFGLFLDEAIALKEKSQRKNSHTMQR